MNTRHQFHVIAEQLDFPDEPSIEVKTLSGGELVLAITIPNDGGQQHGIDIFFGTKAIDYIGVNTAYEEILIFAGQLENAARDLFSRASLRLRESREAHAADAAALERIQS